MTLIRSALELLASCLIYSLIVMLIDFVFILVFWRDLSQIASTLSLVMLVEGGLGLTLGGAVASYSPIASKLGEVFFRSKPWDAKRQREAEKQARTWIATGGILVFAAFLVSAL
jgi:hypothetical protein